jgi:hypothetical protein
MNLLIFKQEIMYYEGWNLADYYRQKKKHTLIDVSDVSGGRNKTFILYLPIVSLVLFYIRMLINCVAAEGSGIREFTVQKWAINALFSDDDCLLIHNAENK